MFELEIFSGKTVAQTKKEWDGYTIFLGEPKDPPTFDSRRLMLEVVKTSELESGWTVVRAVVG